MKKLPQTQTFSKPSLQNPTMNLLIQQPNKSNYKKPLILKQSRELQIAQKAKWVVLKSHGKDWIFFMKVQRKLEIWICCLLGARRDRERERESKSRKEGTNLHKKGQLICQHLGHIFSFTPLEFLDEV